MGWRAVQIGRRLLVLAGATLVSILAAEPGAAQDVGPEPVQVFVLAGQSNMVGRGAVADLQALLTSPETRPRVVHIARPRGGWRARDDVLVWFDGRGGALTVGWGAGAEFFGPELQFGHVVGEALEAPVLLIKTAWDRSSLAVDFRPPSAGGETGPRFERMIEQVGTLLAKVEVVFPKLRGRGWEMSGFVWFQGASDLTDDDRLEAYGDNLRHLIRDVRQAFEAPVLPVVIGEFGVRGNDPTPRGQRLRDIQRSIEQDPEFAGTVRVAPTARFYDRELARLRAAGAADPRRAGSDGPQHYLGSGRAFLAIGQGFGDAMLELLESPPTRVGPR